ncbi:glycerophosphodiester phosphodiesterase [Roseomonas alkaliterrae]|uniref:Glycerophosphoryl diester phosphodiesterase n=1 Tax=Neoroseomonas alkaliterrae TaxID=1452450 RepID=A0A840XKJ0_9PROT|nr:glycerophosphodiester phosphodiesterase family protein [Neoroseomonas alkaliterrae]MBB5689058.1 glycerophosphoryl diester phosphodiesterase [Neoroseomonas alkaliterrae]MBR0674603.1 glycerophosphodiester phosphodiesterase [Neoroseomonas alkaliterrae]
MGGHRSAIASHRGGAFLWPENSLTAFRESARLALEQAECDVHASADGVPIVIHDASLERTTDGTGLVSAHTGQDLSRVRLRGAGGEGVPSLADVLGILRGSAVTPRIEIKTDAHGRPYPGLVARVLEDLDRAGLRGRSWIIGFDAPTMAEALAAGGVAGVAWLLERQCWGSLGIPGVIAVARHYGFQEVGVHESVLDAEALAAVKAAGLGVSVWGANHAPTILRMLALGVDLLATDDPPLAIALRDARG